MKKKTKNIEMRANSLQIASHSFDLRKQNPGLREVYLKSSHKRGSDKSYMLKLAKNRKNRKHVVS